MTLKFRSYCPHLSSAVITGVCYHAQIEFSAADPGFQAC